MISKTKQLGTIGELEVAKKLIELGGEVFTNIGDCSKTDLLVMYKGRITRVQVKTCGLDSESVEMHCAKMTNGKRVRYSKEDIDVIATYCVKKDVILFASIEDFDGKSRALIVRFSESKNGQRKGTNSYRNYLSFDRATKSSSKIRK